MQVDRRSLASPVKNYFRISAEDVGTTGCPRFVFREERVTATGEIHKNVPPLLVQKVSDTIKEIKMNRIGILLVEQNFDMTVRLGDVFYILNKGLIVFDGTREEILAQEELLKQYLSV